MTYFPNRLTGDAPALSTDQGWEPVTRWTRASSNGRLIRCSYCGNTTRVYHFSWCAVTCQGCNRMVDKYEWSQKK